MSQQIVLNLRLLLNNDTHKVEELIAKLPGRAPERIPGVQLEDTLYFEISEIYGLTLEQKLPEGPIVVDESTRPGKDIEVPDSEVFKTIDDRQLLRFYSSYKMMSETGRDHQGAGLSGKSLSEIKKELPKIEKELHSRKIHPNRD